MKIHRIDATDSISATDKPLLKEHITFSGYDKPANANKETFHVTNSSPLTIKKAGIRVTYLDLKDRMLHSREAYFDCVVPPEETRLVSIPTWDIQHTFYYVLGPEPKRVATPYKVKIELLWIESTY